MSPEWPLRTPGFCFVFARQTMARRRRGVRPIRPLPLALHPKVRFARWLSALNVQAADAVTKSTSGRDFIDTASGKSRLAGGLNRPFGES
jgi:hypothetical protein